jgi:hypothetical protein
MAHNKSTPKPKHSKAISEAAAKAVRAGLVKLKRKGLYSGDARNVKITKSQQRLVARYQYVLSGQEKVTKVKKKDIGKLKAAGVEVRKGRAITPANINVRNGKLFQKGSKRGAGIIERLDKNLTLDQSARQAFERLDHPYGIAFQFMGQPSYNVFQTPEELLLYLRTFYGNRSDDELKAALQFFAPDIAPGLYQQEGVVRRAERDQNKAIRKRRRDAERRARKKGKRVSRGH